MTTTTIIAVGEHIKIECGPANPAHPGRLWRMTYDGELVRGLVDVYLFGLLDDIGLRAALFRKSQEPRADAIKELRLAGWCVVLDDEGGRLLTKDARMRAHVVDADGELICWEGHEIRGDGPLSLAYQAARAAFWWHSGDARREQARDRRLRGE